MITCIIWGFGPILTLVIAVLLDGMWVNDYTEARHVP